MGLIRGFRPNIFMTFALSLSLAMLLILFVVTSYYRKERLIQVEAAADALLWQAAQPLLHAGHPISPDQYWQRLQSVPFPSLDLSIANIYLLKKDDTLLFRNRLLNTGITARLQNELRAASTQQQVTRSRIGSQWIFPGRIARMLIVSQPIEASGPYKAIGVLVDLASVKREIVKLNNLMLTYFLVNLVVFTLIGAYRLTRIYMRPIQRMVKRAEEFRGEDAFLFAARSGDDELNHLSKSLNMLLSRLAEDKRQLRQTVAKLEVANTNLERAQDEIVRAETLASVGRLASGVAHEIGNPLGIVQGYLDLLNNPEISPENRADFLKRTEDEIQRINHIIRQLLDLSRPADFQVALVHLHEILEDTVAIVTPQPLMKHISIEIRLGATHDSVLASPEQLRQVFLNLLLNAADALEADAENPGRILITSELVTDREGQSSDGGDMIELYFEDNGPGIPLEVESHIFEPFFTTKEPGKGTGLGLSVSFMIIDSLEGQLTAESLEKGGTRMRIRLPLFAGEAADGNALRDGYDRERE